MLAPMSTFVESRFPRLDNTFITVPKALKDGRNVGRRRRHSFAHVAGAVHCSLLARSDEKLRSELFKPLPSSAPSCGDSLTTIDCELSPKEQSRRRDALIKSLSVAGHAALARAAKLSDTGSGYQQSQWVVGGETAVSVHNSCVPLGLPVSTPVLPQWKCDRTWLDRTDGGPLSEFVFCFGWVLCNGHGGTRHWPL